MKAIIHIGFYSLLICCSISSFNLDAFAKISVETCFTRLLEYQFRQDIKVVKASPYSNVYFVRGINPLKPVLQSLQEVSEKQGRNGGRITVYQSIEGHWYSSYEEAPGAPIGDPRSLIYWVGPKVAEHLGWKLIDDRHIQVSGPKEINSALEELDSQLREKTSVEFIEVENVLSDMDYLKLSRINSTSQKFGIPVAHKRRAPSIYMHDLFFHTTAMLYPRRYLQRASDFNDGIVQFAQFLEKSFSGSVPQHFKFLIELISHARAMDLDSATADLSGDSEVTNLAIVENREIDFEYLKESFHDSFKKLTGGNRNLKDILYDLFVGRQFQDSSLEYDEPKALIKKHLESALSPEQKQAYLSLVKQFFQSHPEYAKSEISQSMNANDFYKHILGRRILLNRALEKLSKTTKPEQI